MTKVEKSGMLINAEKEIVGWFNAGDEVEMSEGDILVSHAKTADKHGVSEEFKAMKAENAPKKEPKEKADSEAKVRGPRIEVPKTGTYTVLKPKVAELAEGEASNQRHEILTKLMQNADFATFWEGTAEKFDHPGRDGEIKTFATTGLFAYAIKRGMISVDK